MVFIIIPKIYAPVKMNTKKSLFTKERISMKLYTIKNLGEKPVSREELRSLFVLVDDRFENGKPTTFTSRFSPAEIVERLTTTSDDHVMASAIV